MVLIKTLREVYNAARAGVDIRDSFNELRRFFQKLLSFVRSLKVNREAADLFFLKGFLTENIKKELPENSDEFFALLDAGVEAYKKALQKQDDISAGYQEIAYEAEYFCNWFYALDSRLNPLLDPIYKKLTKVGLNDFLKDYLNKALATESPLSINLQKAEPS